MLILGLQSRGGVCARYGQQLNPTNIAANDEVEIEVGLDSQGDKQDLASLNTGVITFNHRARGAISLDVAKVVFAHEIGHSFGAQVNDLVHFTWSILLI